jgi:pimeloyl-ACP methyl ester carboxylesterase
MITIQILILIATTLYQAIAIYHENRQPQPGQLIDVGGYRLHLKVQGDANPTIVLDHSLGGVEGYLLMEALAKISRVCIYDRAGYGWSDRSPYPRTSEHIVQELDTLLIKAGIEPPYVLIGNSFGSYNVRLYAHQFPHKVIGMVLTDALHESGMLNLPVPLRALKQLFLAGFIMSILGASVGIIRLLKRLGLFAGIKPELTHFPPNALYPVQRSFCRPKHWVTMAQEMLNLNTSSHQVRIANQFGTMPIVSIKSASFFKPAFWTPFIPLKQANQVREQMHAELCHLSTHCQPVGATQSSHFVWVDQPDVIVNAVKTILDRTSHDL